MIRLYVLDCTHLDNELVYSFSDIINGFVRYKDEAVKLGIEICYEKNKRSDEILQRGDRVDCFMSVWGAMVDTASELYKNRKFLTATFLDDIHWWSEQSLKDRLTFFEKTDLIFTPYARTATTYNEYSNLKSKFVSLHWWAPDKCFDNNISWEQRKNKVLLSGSIHMYPLRKAISEVKNGIVEQLKHSLRFPNFAHQYHGVKYYEYLSRYKGAICASCAPHKTENVSITHPLDYTLSKNFEVLGCGCVGFLEETKDFQELGFEPYKNFVPITMKNFQEQWRYLFKQEAKEIAKAGLEFVRTKHSTKNRILQILNKIKIEHEKIKCN